MIMRMKNPSHPGRLIKGNLEALNLSIEDAASVLQVDNDLLAAITRGEHPVTADIAMRMNKGDGKPIYQDILLLIQVSYDIAQGRDVVETLAIPCLWHSELETDQAAKHHHSFANGVLHTLFSWTRLKSNKP